jgi:hypothetical protein
MRLKRLLPLLAVTLLTLSMFACGPDDVRKFARGINGAASGIGAGIGTVRAFRVAGAIDALKALELAKDALAINTIMGEVVDFTLKQDAIDETGRQSLHAQYSDISERANRLIQNGTIHLKNERVKLIFELGTIAGQAALDVAVDDLAVKLPDGMTITVDAETKKTLETARKKIESNDQRLREAIGNLERLIREGNFGGAGSGGSLALTGQITNIGPFTAPSFDIEKISRPAITIKQ